MKKLLLTCIIALTALVASAQIKDSFFGLTLGKSTVAQADRALKGSDFQKDETYVTCYTLWGYDYMDVTWDCVELKFYDTYADEEPVLQEVKFSRGVYLERDDALDELIRTPDDIAEIDYLDSEARRLGDIFKKEYAQYADKNPDYSKWDFRAFADDSVRLWLECGIRAGAPSGAPYMLSIEYSRTIE